MSPVDNVTTRRIRGVPSMRTIIPAIEILTFLSSFAAVAQRAADVPYDFALQESFVRGLKSANSLLYSMHLKMGEHSGVHSLGSDCEMHIAGVPDQPFGTPAGVVVEPPNLCRQKPPQGSKDWPAYVDDNIVDQDCIAVGFPRIVDAHAGKSFP